MTTIVILKTGDEIIGEMVVHEEFIEVIDPMYIVDGEVGMKLRDALILSADNKLIYKVKDVITYYKPSDILVKYYKKAVEYSCRHTRNATQKQIKYAIEELDEMLHEEANLLKIFAPGSNKLH